MSSMPPQIAGFPWGGVNDATPRPITPVNTFSQAINWLIDKGRLRSAFNCASVFTPPPDGNPILGARTFMDVLSNLHTLVLTGANGYFLNQTSVYTTLGQFAAQGTLPFGIEVMFNKIYFSNGSDYLRYCDGSTKFKVCGNVPGACYYLGKLAGHLIQVFTVEPVTGITTTPYPARLRWCGLNNPLEWDETVDPTAGVADIPDVEDQLTGWSTLGTTGFAFRNNGITTLSPQSSGASPFVIENFSIGPVGVGCSLPYTLATYGTMCAFVALDNIYMFSPSVDSSGISPIGANCVRSIFADLSSASDLPYATMTGQLPGNIDFLAYWLFIPQTNNTTTKVWCYHFASQSWMSDTLPYGKINVFNNVAVA